ncbi:MAG: Cna B-type protein [Bryobacterales bacterium]|nr:Cna B-type protein [Bryobacterales bacterium]
MLAAFGQGARAKHGGLGSASQLPGQNTFGNYPVNALYGPHFINQDLSLAKVFSITEKLRFTRRTDALNAFNHTNLGLPNANVTDPFAGQTTSLASGYNMRRLQFSGQIGF